MRPHNSVRPLPEHKMLDFEEIVSRRADLGAGLYISLTQRCPMRCAHCCTNSTVTAPHQLADTTIQGFLKTLADDDPPSFILMTGGEPLLRPSLVKWIAQHARALGVRTQVLTGGFWAPHPTEHVRDALSSVDLVTISFDSFHAQEIDVEAFLGGLEYLKSINVGVAVQFTHNPENYEFTQEVLGAVGERFHGHIPVYLAHLASVGRWSKPDTSTSADISNRTVGCIKASWPVVSYTGWILGCCDQEVCDSENPPSHLVLGHVNTANWPQVKRRHSERFSLAAVRACGPRVFETDTSESVSDAENCGYCGPCKRWREPADSNDCLAKRYAEQDGPLRTLGSRLLYRMNQPQLLWPGRI